MKNNSRCWDIKLLPVFFQKVGAEKRFISHVLNDLVSFRRVQNPREMIPDQKRVTQILWTDTIYNKFMIHSKDRAVRRNNRYIYMHITKKVESSNTTVNITFHTIRFKRYVCTFQSRGTETLSKNGSNIW